VDISTTTDEEEGAAATGVGGVTVVPESPEAEGEGNGAIPEGAEAVVISSDSEGEGVVQGEAAAADHAADVEEDGYLGQAAADDVAIDGADDSGVVDDEDAQLHVPVLLDNTAGGEEAAAAAAEHLAAVVLDDALDEGEVQLPRHSSPTRDEPLPPFVLPPGTHITREGDPQPRRRRRLLRSGSPGVVMDFINLSGDTEPEENVPPPADTLLGDAEPEEYVPPLVNISQEERDWEERAREERARAAAAEEEEYQRLVAVNPEEEAATAAEDARLQALLDRPVVRAAVAAAIVAEHELEEVLDGEEAVRHQAILDLQGDAPILAAARLVAAVSIRTEEREAAAAQAAGAPVPVVTHLV
jgi:hypothetical protein